MGVRMTSREKEVIKAIQSLGGEAHPNKIGGRLGISGDYAEQICRDLVWAGSIIKKGLKYAIFKEAPLKASQTR